MNDTKATVISKSMLSLVTVLLLMSGCNSDGISKSPDDSTVASETIQVEAHSSKSLIIEGKAIDFSVSGDVNNIVSLEWRDENGKLLSTAPKFNRKFTKS